VIENDEVDAMKAAVLAVDGGNSKADVALVGGGGELLGAVRGPTVSHQAVGLEAGMTRLDDLVRETARRAELPTDGRTAFADIGVYSLAGADYPSDVSMLEGELAARGLAATDVVINDTFGALRAGTDRDWGIVLICGQGINAAAIAPDGRRARFDALGEISGDWGGGTSIGQAGLAAAVRATDGRGPRTRLERDVPLHFGLTEPAELTRALYEGRIRMARLSELPPVVFAAAIDADEAARSIVERLAEELATMAGALIRRLDMAGLDPDVVLAGGVFRTNDQRFFDSIRERITAVAPRATLARLSTPPVTGAALLGLDRLLGRPVDAETAARLRAALADWSAAQV
jgi:N-acetylglucosamine kinase-like BadF-type ATPase